MSLQKLTKIIQEANPELMELSFGCWFSDDEICEVIRYLGVNHVGTHAFYVKSINDVALYQGRFPKGKILGHPITLEHVLVAMNLASVFTWLVDCHGYFSAQHDVTERKIILANHNTRWQLGKSYEDQSKEFKTFLLDILKP